MKRKIILGVLFGFFLLDFILVLFGYTDNVDTWVYEVVISLKSDGMTSFCKWISFLASTKMIILYNILLLIVVFLSKRKEFLFLTMMSLSSGITNRILKWFIKRERPLGIALVEETFYSFPSGHAMISVLFFGTLLFMIQKSSWKGKKIWTCGILLFIFFIGFSRIYLGVHYFSDVLGGYLFGTFLLFLAKPYYKRREKR